MVHGRVAPNDQERHPVVANTMVI